MADTLFLKFRGDEFEWLIFDSSGGRKADGLGSASQFNECFEGRAAKRTKKHVKSIMFTMVRPDPWRECKKTL